MSGLERLVPLIYHEKQQPGSQLCAQHALNNLLQGDYFSAPDLAQFAHQLDALEGSFNNDAGPVSNNMDDTGFFSIQVLDRALRIWGFCLVRWRSEELKDQHEKPHSQMAFILNHQQHWFSLRRFGHLKDPDNGHWFNLNSFLDSPEWVGKLYLGMVLAQAEDEGYSVFAVIPAADEPSLLPQAEADDIASTLPQPTSSQSGTRLSTSRVSAATTPGASSSKPPAPISGFEDEDMELQAALQASLSGTGLIDYAAFAEGTAVDNTVSDLSTPPTVQAEASPALQFDAEDPVAASMARNRAIMERMQRHQEMALRAGLEDEVAQAWGSPGAFNAHGTGESSRTRSDVHEQESDEVEEEIRRAIELSRTTGNNAEDGGNMDIDGDDDEEWLPQVHPAPPTNEPPPVSSRDRVYDDEDSELQAALKASLEGLPEGFVVPETPPRPIPPPVVATNAQLETATPIPVKEDEGEAEEEEATPVVEIDPAELRRRRLARFGGQ